MQGLALLRRANEGYSKPLEKVLRMSYGRQGKRRRQLVGQYVEPEVPTDNLVISDMIKNPRRFHDGWKPPSMVVDLMRAQSHHYPVHRLRVRPHVRALQPPIPKANIYGRPVAFSRRKNIRRVWYLKALNSLYPPLPHGELGILEGLISGEVPWKPVGRRTPIGSVESSSTSLARFLAEGPEKGHTFEKYTDGRPHHLTRRFMRHLWQRISALVPRIGWDETKEQRSITWDYIKPPTSVSLEVDDASDLFEGIENDSRLDSGQTGEEPRHVDP